MVGIADHPISWCNCNTDGRDTMGKLAVLEALTIKVRRYEPDNWWILMLWGKPGIYNFTPILMFGCACKWDIEWYRHKRQFNSEKHLIKDGMGLLIFRQTQIIWFQPTTEWELVKTYLPNYRGGTCRYQGFGPEPFVFNQRIWDYLDLNGVFFSIWFIHHLYPFTTLYKVGRVVIRL